MYINTGYLNHSHLDFKDKSRPLVVGSCGIYRLSGDPRMPTYRPKGRLDYQIIYIASGLGHFHFDKQEMRRSSLPETWCCFVQKNYRNMNIMEKIKPKCTGFTSQVPM